MAEKKVTIYVVHTDNGEEIWKPTPEPLGDTLREEYIKYHRDKFKHVFDELESTARKMVSEGKKRADGFVLLDYTPLSPKDSEGLGKAISEWERKNRFVIENKDEMYIGTKRARLDWNFEIGLCPPK